jgi:endonuclease/exonuclease/phosphatase family metal-dependent hydrolase
MKRYLIAALSLLLCVTAGAQRLGVREEVRADWNKSSGLDCLLDLSPKALTPVPKGYEAVYISHYGRHGSRYAYTGDAYSILLNMLAEGRREGNLTARGESLLNDLEPFWEYVQYRVGDLTEIGWNQHQEIARTMVKNYPTVFRKGSSVDACSSPSVRAIMSMSSCCAALSRLAPKTSVYEHQGMMDVQATRPNQGANPFKYEGPAEVFPYPETSEQFFLRHFPNYKDVLARFFKNPDKALGRRNPYNVFFHLYMFVAGMNSLPPDVRIDVKDFFTVEEFATLWETDNYERFREYHAYRTPCSSIVDDMVEKASQRLAAGSRGADLRYGHDHVVMALELIMDLDGFDRAPADPDDLVYWFQTFRSPMAANIQFIFFNPRKGRTGDTLVKVLLNGEEARLGDLEGFPYYRWDDVKAYLKARTDQFVYRQMTLVSYNVGVFSKYEDNTVPQVADVIRGADATLVALNELDSCNRRHATFQLKELADELGGWAYQFASAFPFAGGAYGNGVVSRDRVISRYRVHLPKSDGSEPRSVAVVETDRCVFASVHLDYVGERSQIDQVNALNDWFKAVYTGAKKPVLLCGDFNAEPDSEAIRLMRESWTQLSGTDFTYSTKNPRKCIDYVFAWKEAAPVEVLSSEVLTAGTETLSDHFPVKVVVKF